MKRRPVLVASSLALLAVSLGLGLALAASSCGGDVDTASAGSGSGGACPGSQIFCLDECGSDYFPAVADCIDGKWVCPEGTVDPDTCPAGTCNGAPLSCEFCGSNGYECHPTDACVEGCGGIVCAECPPDQMGELLIGSCSCTCDSSGQFNCVPSNTCCQVDMDCGDKKLTPCVNGICKEPVPDGCWKDVECPPDMVCEGASVCPCNFDCLLPDMPGKCVPK